jgi:toxin ParE1/3/4
MSRKSRILWTGPALDDLRSIKNYVSPDKPEVARRLADTIKRSVLRLAEFPLSGRNVPEFPGTELREVILAPYRIVYELREPGIVILRVWHGWVD